MPKNFFQLAIASVHIALFSAICFSQGVTVTITPESGNPQGAPNPRWLFTVEFQNGAVTNGSTEGPYFVDHFQIFTSNVGAIDPTNDSCMFEYTNRNTEPRFHIFADTPYIQQAFGPWTDWSSGISENSQCRVWAQDATRTTPQQGPNLIVRFYVEGTSLMEGNYGVRIAYGNWYSNWSSGWGNFANYAIWTPRSTLPNPPTKTVSVVSQGNQGATFDVSMSSSGGAGNGVRAITRALLIVNTTNLADGQNACYAIYHRTSRELLLIDSSGNVGLGARLLGTSPGASSTFSSSNCTVDMGQAWFSESFSTHRIVVPTVFSNAFVNRPGVKNVFFLPIDRPGNSDANANYPVNTWPPALTYNISGMVGVGTTGVPGIPVNLNGSQTRTTTTDASGNYSFTSVPNGNYTVSPELSGYTFLPPGQTFTNVASNVTGNFSIATVEFPILPGGTPPGPVDPTPVVTPPADVTASATFCNDISGIWNAEGARSYSLFQAGSGVTGTATQLDPVCGNVTWDINGSTIGTGLFTLTASNPSPPVDSCGNESGSGSVNLQILSCSIATQSIVEPPPVGPTGMRRALAPATTTWTRNSTPLGLQVTANVYTNNVAVVRTGQNKTGNLSVSINGASSRTLGQSNQVSAGTSNFSLQRLNLTPGQYGTVTATWDNASLPLPVAFNVVGRTRYSTYLTVDETTCSGTSAQAFIIDFQTQRQTCLAQIATLDSQFMTQVNRNGSGVSPSLGRLVPLTTSWMNGYCKIPQGLGSIASGGLPDNTFVRLTQAIAGSCRIEPVPGVTVAVSPNPKFGGGFWQCSDQILLVDPNTSNNNSIRVVTDHCPGCSTGFNGQLAHIDAFATPACNADDTGNFFTIRLR